MEEGFLFPWPDRGRQRQTDGWLSERPDTIKIQREKIITIIIIIIIVIIIIIIFVTDVIIIIIIIIFIVTILQKNMHYGFKLPLALLHMVQQLWYHRKNITFPKLFKVP